MSYVSDGPEVSRGLDIRCPSQEKRGGGMWAYVVVYGAEHLLRRKEQRRHLPDCHFEIHLRELEQSVPGRDALRVSVEPAVESAVAGRDGRRARPLAVCRFLSL